MVVGDKAENIIQQIMSEVEVPDDFAVPKGVVKCNDASLPHQKKTELVVAVVSLLVRINEGEVEGVLLSPGHQAAQSLQPEV